MVLKVAIQMDPIESIDIGGDSTFALGLEAQKRGFELYYYLPENMSLRDGAVTARIRSLALKDKSEDYFSAGPEEVRHLTDMDVVLMRQDPPFDMAYISATHMLEQICDHTLVVNNPCCCAERARENPASSVSLASAADFIDARFECA